jgi:glycosyltransferase involved in cell wall biosynthesis
MTGASIRPLVTVIIGSYNQAKYVEECLESVRRQTYRPVQLIIVDDCSTDDSVRVIRRWMDDHQSDGQLIVHDSNRGVSAVANAALSAAKGKYVALLSADDAWAGQKLERQVDLLESLPDEVGVAYGGVCNIDEHGRATPRPSYFHDADEDIYRALIRRRNFIVASSTLVRKACFDAVGPYDESLLVEDFDMWLRLAHAYRFAHSPDASTYRRKHPASFSALRRHSTRWLETVILVDLKQLGVDPEFDTEIRQRLLRNLRSLYTRPDARFDYCVARVLEKYRHPLLLWLRMLRKVKAPFILVRVSWRAWFSVASLGQATGDET